MWSARLRHRVVAVLRGGPGIGEPRAQRGIEDGHLTPVGLLGLGHQERCTAHALHPPGDEQVPLSARDRPGRIHHRGQTAGAQPVEGHTGDLHRQTGQQTGAAGHIPAVFSRLVRAPGNDVLATKRAARHQRGEGARQQIVGPHRRQCPGVATERRADPIVDKSVDHECSCLLPPVSREHWTPDWPHIMSGPGPRSRRAQRKLASSSVAGLSGPPQYRHADLRHLTPPLVPCHPPPRLRWTGPPSRLCSLAVIQRRAAAGPP